MEHRASAPHEYVVPAGVSHGHPWNAGDGDLHLRAAGQAVTAEGEIEGRVRNLLTIHDLLMPGSFLAGPPRWARRALLGAL